MDCIELTAIEAQRINAGSNKVRTFFWEDIASLTKTVVYGFMVFSTEGGRNAGISVR